MKRRIIPLIFLILCTVLTFIIGESLKECDEIKTDLEYYAIEKLNKIDNETGLVYFKGEKVSIDYANLKMTYENPLISYSEISNAIAEVNKENGVDSINTLYYVSSGKEKKIFSIEEIDSGFNLYLFDEKIMGTEGIKTCQNFTYLMEENSENVSDIFMDAWLYNVYQNFETVLSNVSGENADFFYKLLVYIYPFFRTNQFYSEKPVIYLYPDIEKMVSVKVFPENGFSVTYPKYNNIWLVKASPNGILIDETGLEYNYLYWEGKGSHTASLTSGFCIKGEDTAEFLEKKLNELGLNRKEANEFIVYWLPKMEKNNYNLISFDSSVYETYNPLLVEPLPDNIIRVFMTWKGLDAFVNVEKEEIKFVDRNNLSGFTVVEWGGVELQ